MPDQKDSQDSNQKQVHLDSEGSLDRDSVDFCVESVNVPSSHA